MTATGSSTAARKDSLCCSPKCRATAAFATVLVLAVKARLEIAEGRFSEAIDTLRSGLTLGRNIAQGPTLIHVLVGIACSQILLKQYEDLIQQPDAPNLYWALTVLPHPIIDPRKAMLDESQWLEISLPFLKRLEGGPMALSEIQEAIAARCLQNAGRVPIPRPRLRGWETLAQAAYVEAAQKEARASLIKQGLKADVVEAMPTFQVVSLFAYREFRDTREEVLKWIHVPEGRKHPAFEQAAKRHRHDTDRLDRLLFRGLIQGLGSEGGVEYEKRFPGRKPAGTFPGDTALLSRRCACTPPAMAAGRRSSTT